MNRKVLWRRLILIAAAIVIGGSVYSWNAKNLMGNQMPMPFGYGFSVILSGSMEPELRVNDLVLVKETEEISVGDIVVYQQGETLVIHRIIEIQEDTVILQGDANNIPDAPIKKEAVKGRLMYTVPKLGWVIQILRQPWAIAALLAAAFALTELSYRKEKREGNEELDAIQQEIREILKEINENK